VKEEDVAALPRLSRLSNVKKKYQSFVVWPRFNRIANMK